MVGKVAEAKDVKKNPLRTCCCSNDPINMKKSNLYERLPWRYGLVIISLMVIAASLLYTSSVAYRLQINEQKDVALWAEAQQRMITAPSDADVELNLAIIESNTEIPLLLTDEHYRLIDAVNYPNHDIERDTAFFRHEIAYLRENTEPIVVGDANYSNYLFYRQSLLITSLEWFPYVQLGILGLLMLLAYLTFSFNRRAEQERVWVGMAKETAHQLGTPLTSLIGWIENLKAFYPEDETLLSIADEMNTDVELLRLVADRFSKIGTRPELEVVNVYDHLARHLAYIRQRASRKITFDFPDGNQSHPILAKVNPLLFDWVVENLLKNALDAMGGSGNITATVEELERYVYLKISDTGKGIPKNKFKTVFQPGYSTKKRGWGLGLSLCKRIIENYHSGKIFVAKSVEGEGTTFCIQLPAVDETA